MSEIWTVDPGTGVQSCPCLHLSDLMGDYIAHRGTRTEARASASSCERCGSEESGIRKLFEEIYCAILLTYDVSEALQLGIGYSLEDLPDITRESLKSSTRAIDWNQHI